MKLICQISKTRTAFNFTPTKTDKIGFILPKPTNSRAGNSKKVKPRRPIKSRRRLRHFPITVFHYKYGGWHLTRTIAFAPNGKLYVSVGSSCNACDEKEKERATVLEMNPDGSGQRIFVKGLRNAVGLKWMANNLFASNQGSDHLGLNKPDETFYALKDGADYGWGSCYQSNGKIFLDKTPPNKLKKPTNRLKSCANIPVSYAYFPAHSSVMGFDYFDDENADASDQKTLFSFRFTARPTKTSAKATKSS